MSGLSKTEKKLIFITFPLEQQHALRKEISQRISEAKKGKGWANGIPNQSPCACLLSTYEYWLASGKLEESRKLMRIILELYSFEAKVLIAYKVAEFKAGGLEDA